MSLTASCLLVASEVDFNPHTIMTASLISSVIMVWWRRLASRLLNWSIFSGSWTDYSGACVLWRLTWWWWTYSSAYKMEEIWEKGGYL